MTWGTGAARRSGLRRGSGRTLDAAVAFVAFAVTVVVVRHGGVDPARSDVRDLDLLGAALAAGSASPLLAWRRWPVGAFVAAAAVTVVMAGMGYPVDLTPAATVALFLLALQRPRDGHRRLVVAAIIGSAFAAYLGASGLARQALPGSELLHSGLIWALAWFGGERVRLRQEQVADLRERTRRAERDAERDRLLAVAQERTRIARDLHDSAGHAMSLIAVRAGAARLRHSQDPDRSLAALQAIEDLARQTVEDIEHLVGSLRGNGRPEDIAAPVGLASVDTVIGHHRAAGLAVTLRTVGVPRPSGGAADQAAYRIIQQALTNAAQHGAGCADVELSFCDTAITVTVTNPVAPAAPHRSGGGNGLVGMRERASLLGGTFDAARDKDAARGQTVFRVHARIPYGGHRP